MINVDVNIKRLNDSARIPAYAHGSDIDSGMDLCASEGVILRPMIPTLVKTGLSIELPPGFEAQIRSRSGIALKNGVFVLNAPGTIDPGYRGEIGVILMWTGYPNTDGGPHGYKINVGDRVAQMVCAPYAVVNFREQELQDSIRGEGGFGSTGVK